MTVTTDVSTSASTKPYRLVILSLTYKPTDRVINYTLRLLDQEGIRDRAEITLVGWDANRWRVAGLDPWIRVYAVRAAEVRNPFRRAERLFVYRIPGGISALIQRAVSATHTRAVFGKPVDFLNRMQRRVSGILHRRIYVPIYRHVRPHVMVRSVGRTMKDFDYSGIDRVVVADGYGIKYGWKLAQRHPDLAVTTMMDKVPIG